MSRRSPVTDLTALAQERLSRLGLLPASEQVAVGEEVAPVRKSFTAISRRAIFALAVVGVCVAGIAGFTAWSARPDPTPVAVAPVNSPSPTPAATVVVAVMGRVHRPGLVSVPPGSRVADALTRAGGPLSRTDLGLLNVARKVTDGELIVVGSTAPGSAGAAAAGQGGQAALVNLNSATPEQLDALPGVGGVLVQRIIEFRTSHQGFSSVEQLRQVEGIGDSRFRRLKALVTV